MKKTAILFHFILIISSSLNSIGQETNVSWAQLTNAIVSGTTLQKDGNGKGSAISEDILYGFGAGGLMNNGYFRYVADQAVEGKQIGFSIYPSKHFKRAELKYSFYFNKVDKVRIMEEGVVIATFDYVIGDEFIIAREDDLILYKINNVVVRNVKVNPHEDLILEAMLLGQGATFSNVKKNYSGQPFKVVVDANTDNLQINLTISGGNPPYSYLWSNGAKTEDITVKLPGVYSVRIKDSFGNSAQRTISLDQKVVWTSFYRTEEVNETLNKTGNGQWGGAKGTIPIVSGGDGWVEYTLENTGQSRAIGFVSTGTAVTKPQDIKYGIYIQDDYTVRIIENNVILLKFSYADGDIFKVERQGLTFIYTRNDEVMHKTTLSSSEELFIAGAVRTGATLKKVRFGGDVPEYVSHNFEIGNDIGTISINGPTGNLPYTYFLSSEPINSLNEIYYELKDTFQLDSLTFFNGKINSTNFSFTDLPAGEYYVAVFDNNASKIIHEHIVLSAPVQIHNSDYVIVSSENIWSVGPSSPNGVARGEILAELPVNESGGYEFEMTEFYDFTIGYKNQSSFQPESAADYLFAIDFIGKTGGFNIFLNGTNRGKRFARLTDKIALAKEQNDFVLYMNKLEIFRAPTGSVGSGNLVINFIMKGSAKSKPAKIFGKVSYPKPVVTVAYPTCGEFDGDLTLTGSSTVTLNSCQLTSNVTGLIITPTSLCDYQNLPIATYTLVVNYTVTYTVGALIFNVPLTLTKQIAIGYVVDWQIINPLATQVLSGTVNTITPIGTSTSTAISAYGNVQTKIGENNWIQFETMVQGAPPPFDKEGFYLQNIANTTVAGMDFSSFPPGFLTGQGAFASIPLLTSLASPNGVYRFEESGGTFSLYKNSATIPFVTASSTIPGPFKIAIWQYGQPQFITTVTSFCPNTDIYVTPKRDIEGGYYVVPLDDVLRFEFLEEYAEPGNLNYKVRDYKGEAVTGLSGLNDAFGDNRLSLDVSGLLTGYYILEIENDKNEIWYLRFKVQ